MAPAVSLCRRSAACLVSYSTVSSASASRCVMENNDPRNSPWILHCTETCNYKLCILSDTGSYFSCTRISFAFKMSTQSPRWAALEFSPCPSVPWHMIPPGSHCIPRRTWAHTGQQSHLALLHKPLAHQTASASSSHRNARGQLLVMPSHSATHMAWHLSNSEARNSHSYILSVTAGMRSRVVFLHSYNGSNCKNERTSSAGGVCRACWVWLRGPPGAPHI